ncbi:hypothetical protein MSAS_41420 [Mycobacterium saskatchewanense]|nr:hypothetical protein MSAS_41420 [Mycobacterium saskatchewanense]
MRTRVVCGYTTWQAFTLFTCRKSINSQGVIMSVIGGAVRGVGQAVNRAATATTAAAGAAGGAAVNGVVGGVTGAAEGVKRGISSGSHSAPAAAVAFGALGVAGLVEWPILLAVGGGALLLQRLTRKAQPPAKANLKPVPVAAAPDKPAQPKAAAKPAPAKKTARRRAAGSTTELRSTN